MRGCRGAVKLPLVAVVHKAGWEESKGTLAALVCRELECTMEKLKR